MRKILPIIFVLILCAAICSCSANTPGEDLTADVKADENSTYNFKKSETSPPTSYSNFKTAAIDFSTNMLSGMLEKDDNALYSPSALYYSLSLLQNAASGSTQNQIQKLTGETLSTDDLNTSSGYFYSRTEALCEYKKDSEKSYIDLNSDLFFNDDVSIGQNFLIKNADFYRNGIFRLDFSDKDFTKKVNAYISEKSKAAYTSSPEKDAGILLLNSAFIDDLWLDGCKKITDESFKGKSKTVKTKFLSTDEFYIEDKNCEGFVKDLKNTPAKFIALMPKNDNIKDFVKKLKGYKFFELADSTNVLKTCEAVFPRFSKKGTINFTDNKKLSFLKTKGSYSGLSYNNKTKVSDIIQDYEISISKDGIGTDKISSSKSVKKEPQKTLKFNRPFLFAVVDNESYIPIFMGVISDI